MNLLLPLTDTAPIRPNASRSCLEVLVVDDNLINQKVAASMLQRAGHAVRFAGNGLEALAALEQHAFDLVLMDVQMPLMDGLEATAAIRAREQEGGRRLPIIAVTTYRTQADRERCLAAGMDGFVPKPVRSQELYQTIAAVLSRSGAAVPTPQRTEKPLFNRDAMMARLGGDQELFRELVQLFMEDCPRWLEAARHAIHNHDLRTLKTTTHTMSGSVSYLDAREVQQAAQRLEDMSSSGDLSDAAEAFRDLVEAVERLLTVLRVEPLTRAAG